MSEIEASSNVISLPTKLLPGSDAWRDVERMGVERIANFLADGDEPAADAEARALAKQLGVQAGSLLKKARRHIVAQPSLGNTLNLFDPSPITNPKPLASLLEITKRTITARVTLSEEAVCAIALWCAGTWGIRSNASGRDGPEIYPRLWVKSATKRSGKTTLIETIEMLVRRPLRADSISAAAVYRVIGETPPTLLIDEADVLLRQLPDAIGLLNSGHSRSGAIIRCVEMKRNGVTAIEPIAFPTFAPVVVAGIGETSATLADRSVRVALHRRDAVASNSTNIRRAKLIELRDAIGPHFAAWGDQIAFAMAEGLPAATLRSLGLGSERDEDNFEPLLTIAQLAGGVWPARAWQAAKVLAGVATETRGPEVALAEIWAAIRELRLQRAEAWFDAIRTKSKLRPKGPLRFAPSRDIVAMLLAHGGNFAGGLTEAQALKALARAVRIFGIEPVKARAIGSITGGVGVSVPTWGYRVSVIRSVHRQHNGEG